ncbi:hypothetical protein CBU02nite_27950 [Clostridium butyricum]|uniref:Phage tail tape measure protein n=2 Tax=Clostridium butyricum TaxID=1492 RepID=A0A512TPV4_CLOBU|nr:hypothetical protein [Clostridium butyricum]NOW21740.1 phage-related minor tail protein [Clostridium butyricum]GEQ22289.1 hypothetical protein CBU02nite_27950 [Clostridium butyricum]
MADRIKGITIELDGETTGLKKALGDITKQSIDIQKELKDVDRLLKFDPGNTEALAQKQKLLSEQIEVTSKKLDGLKSAQSQVEQQFKNGDIGEQQYRSFQREIEFTESSIKKLKQSLSKIDDGSNVDKLKKDMKELGESTEEAEDKVGELKSGLSQLVIGAATGVGISQVIEDAFDTSSLNTKLSISMQLDEGSVQSVKEAINNITSYGVDAESALEGVRRQWALNKDASDESNSEVVKGAAAIVSAYGDVDFTELIQETNELSSNLGITDQEALALTYSLLKVGFPPDQLDIITEYGSQLARAGYSAEEIQGIMAAGVETGTWNIDVLLDGLKEGRIVMSEIAQGVGPELEELFAQIDVSGKQLSDWGKDIAAGGSEGSVAMQELAQAVSNIDDATLQNQIGTTIWGTLWEENGTKITDTILGMNDNLKTAEQNQNDLNGAISDLDSDPMIQFQTALADLKLALSPLLEIISNLIGKFAQWVSNNPKLAATITAIVSALGILMGILTGIAPLVMTLASLAGTMTVSIGAIALPVLGVVAAITALVAAGVLLYTNWDTIKVKAAEIWEGIKATISNALNGIVTFFTVTIPQAFQTVIDFVTNNWQQLLLFLVNPFAGAFALLYSNCDGFKTFIDGFIQSVITFFQTGWNNIVTFFTESVPAWLESMYAWFAELPNKIAYGLGEALGSIIKWGTDTINYLTTNVPVWIENISTWFSELPGKIWTWLVNVVTNLGTWGSNVASWISTNVSAWITNIVTYFTQLPGQIWTWLTNCVTNMTTWGGNMLTEAKTGMTDVFNGIVDTFTDLPSKMMDIGKNIVAGIKQGISDAWNGMKGWIGGLCDSFIDGVKEKMDIHSPSRVMRQLGVYTGEGFGLGIGDTVNSISKQANAIADAAIPNVDAGTYTASVDTSSINGLSSSSSSITLDSVLEKMDSLVDAFNNMGIYLDTSKVGKLVAPSVSSNLAFSSGRKGF